VKLPHPRQLAFVCVHSRREGQGEDTNGNNDKGNANHKEDYEGEVSRRTRILWQHSKEQFDLRLGRGVCDSGSRCFSCACPTNSDEVLVPPASIAVASALKQHGPPNKDPDASLAPVPQTQMKSWYNTYLYVPEEHSHQERRFTDRYVQGADGEWIDAIKARRMSSFMVEKREQAMLHQMERAMIMSGSVMKQTGYTDPYTGEPLVACRGELLPRQQLMERYEEDAVHMLKDAGHELQAGFDFANLRVPWPFGRPYRNKQVSHHAYDWFDRQNPYIPTDASVEFMELPSMYMEKEQYDRWGACGDPSGSGMPGYVSDRGMQRVQHVQM